MEKQGTPNSQSNLEKKRWKSHTSQSQKLTIKVQKLEQCGIIIEISIQMKRIELRIKKYVVNHISLVN